MKKVIPLIIVVPALLALACSLTSLLPQAATTPTSAPTATRKADTPTPPHPTEMASPSPTLAQPTQTATALPDIPIIFYYFVPELYLPPEGSVVILKEILVLAPEYGEPMRSADIVANLRAALKTMLQDSRNAWDSTKVSITEVTFRAGAAKIDLQGKYFAPGDIVLIAARWQMLLTVFAEEPVQTAVITLNGKNIANMGISNQSQVKPDNFTYTRADIESFIEKSAYRP